VITGEVSLGIAEILHVERLVPEAKAPKNQTGDREPLIDVAICPDNLTKARLSGSFIMHRPLNTGEQIQCQGTMNRMFLIKCAKLCVVIIPPSILSGHTSPGLSGTFNSTV
jgi:hypothetical protein